MKFFLKNKKTIFWLTLLSTFYFLLSINFVFAENPPEELPNPTGAKSLYEIIGRLIHLVLGLVGVLALIMFIYGGITWMTSGGNAEQIKKGKNTFIWSFFGLVAVFMAYSLISYLIDKVIIGQ